MFKMERQKNAGRNLTVLVHQKQHNFSNALQHKKI